MAAPPAGYSGTPLVKKLGIRAGHRVCLLRAPPGFDDTLGELPEGVVPTAALGRTPLDVGLVFVTAKADLVRQVPKLQKAIAPDGAFWACWPKKASKVPTDVTEDVVREVCLPLGLVDVKVCAVDATWSGLKLVIRKALR